MSAEESIKESVGNQVRVIPCETWDDFIKEVRRGDRTLPFKNYLFAGPDEILWRGHADPSWKLESKLERGLKRFRTSPDESKNAAERGLTVGFYDRICKDILA